MNSDYVLELNTDHKLKLESIKEDMTLLKIFKGLYIVTKEIKSMELIYE